MTDALTELPSVFPPRMISERQLVVSEPRRTAATGTGEEPSAARSRDEHSRGHVYKVEEQ